MPKLILRLGVFSFCMVIGGFIALWIHLRSGETSSYAFALFALSIWSMLAAIFLSIWERR